ncbi:hypothetical protein CRUP_032528 [Coryphaenoides rupestris]|nr:hypothetical protein CRUP_032528 [Coryphaenoides rupestris]
MTTELNLQSREPLNHNTCTKCKTQVCSFCGFSPPDSASKRRRPEQPQQAKASPSVQTKVDKAPSESSKAAASQSAPKAGQSTCPLCKVGLNMGSKDPPNYSTCTDCKNTVCNQCGFSPMPNVGAPPDAAKPAESSVTGKMFGFGSSIFNSASTLITTPPVSPKMSPAKDTKTPAVQKAEQEKKPDQPQQATASPSVQTKVDKAPSESSKAAASQSAPKAGQSTCPLCKVGLNMGSKDPPNYSTCTECKNAVCNQCEGVAVSHLPDAEGSGSV